MKYLINQAGSVEDIRSSLKCNAGSYSTDDLWSALRNERQNKNRISVVRMLRRALRRTLKSVAFLIVAATLLTACSSQERLTRGELAVLAAYGRAQTATITVYDLPQTIYFVDSTTVWTPCGEGWYCRSREIEKYMNPKSEKQ